MAVRVEASEPAKQPSGGVMGRMELSLSFFRRHLEGREAGKELKRREGADRSVRATSRVYNPAMRKAFAVLFLLTISLPLFGQSKPDVDDLKKQAISAVEGRQVFTQQMVDQIFSYSELGFQEHETSRYVTGILEKNGFKVERGVAEIPTAWIATYGSGKPVIAFISDLDCIPRASQKPGVAYHDPIIEGAPGHGEGHNTGSAVNVTAALVLRELMEKYKIRER